MEKRKEQEARIKTIILNMDSSNKKCADCENENVTFVSINNGTVICSDCAEKHKHLSYWISFIKSFTEKWDDYLLKFLKNGGNSRYLKFCKDYKIENIKSIDRYKTRGVEYYRLILKSEVMGFDPPDNINVNSAGEILENIENNYPEFENYSYVKHVDLEKLEKQFEIDKKFNEENNAGLFQTFSGILGNFGKKLNEAKDNIVGKVNEKLNEEGGLMEKMKGVTEGVKNKYYQFMGKTEELNKNDNNNNNIQKNVKENVVENQNKNIENISFNDLKELKEQKNKNLTNKKIEDSNKNNKEEKIIVDDKKEETNSNEEKLDEVENQENLTNKNEETNENESEKIENKNETNDKKEEIIQQNENSNFNEEKIENNKINEEKNITLNQEKQTTKKIEKNEEKELKKEESKEINNNEEKNNKKKLDDIINEKEEKEKNKKEEEKKIDIKKTQTNESNKISDKEDILKKETLRSVTTSEMFLDENQLNEILGDDKEEEFN